MTRSTTVYRDVALTALTAEKDHWTEVGMLDAVLSYAWKQLLYRCSTADLEALVAEMTADLAEED